MQWRIDSLWTAGSTNDVARERVLAAWGRGESAHGIVITAARQTDGRGQHGRRWESPAGGLYFSAVVENVPVEYRGKLALVAGVAAAEGLDLPTTFFGDGNGAEAVQPTGVRLRWPNDLLLGDKKVGGILCESVAMGQRFAAIIGIGINVLTAVEDFPVALRANATSLLVHDGRLRTVTGVLDAILQRLGAEIEVLGVGGWADIVARARGRDGLRGRRLTLERNGIRIDGMAAGIGEGGALRLATETGIIDIDAATVLAVDGRPLRDASMAPTTKESH